MDDLRALADKQEIMEVITELFIATDERDWPRVIDCFTQQVLFDMSSLTGAKPWTMASTDIAAGWERGLAPLAAVHHQAGNFRIRLHGDEAAAFCYAIASHYRPNPTGRNTRVFVGSYDVGLRRDGPRWRIDRFRFNLKYVEGNLELEKG
jgi:hypothetical protein